MTIPIRLRGYNLHTTPYFLLLSVLLKNSFEFRWPPHFNYIDARKRNTVYNFLQAVSEYFHCTRTLRLGLIISSYSACFPYRHSCFTFSWCRKGGTVANICVNKWIEKIIYKIRFEAEKKKTIQRLGWWGVKDSTVTRSYFDFKR